MTTENILSLIPQSHPFVMIDELLFADEKITRTSFVVNQQNILCEENNLSEAGVLENIAQTAAAGAGFRAKQKNRNVEQGYIAAIKKFEIFSLPEINDRLITEVIITENIFTMTTIEGKIFSNDRLIAQCDMKIIVASND